MVIPGFSDFLFYLSVNTASPSFLEISNKEVVATRSISLEKRFNDAWVNQVFKENILLNLAYLDGRVINSSDINWVEIRKPFTQEFTLEPNQTFAFQEDALPEYKNTIVKTTNAHFNLQEGFRHSGLLAGDGVCHLASLIYWAAKDAGLAAVAPANHDFRTIPQIPREYGVSIYSMPGQISGNAMQNLYITNNTNGAITFVFTFDGEILTVSVKTEHAFQKITI